MWLPFRAQWNYRDEMRIPLDHRSGEGYSPGNSCPRCFGTNIDWNERVGGERLLLATTRLFSRLTRRLLPLRLWCRDCRHVFRNLHAFPRIVIGYHGCERDFAKALIAGRVSIDEWRVSQNDYDWQGEGIYFWEHAPGRAWQWARDRYPDRGAVVATEIELARCLDLGDTAYTGLLRRTYQGKVDVYTRQGLSLPKNEGRKFKLRRLDRLVINRLTRGTDRSSGVYY
jgi:hypothetical protein